MSQDEAPRDFIREIIAKDVAAGTHEGRVHTRFPPEPNGYLHIGHAKSICLNFGIAAEFGGQCNLRFDDTNPETEDVDFVKAIQEDIRWLGFDWEDRLYFASDYFDRFHAAAVELITKGLAYVDDLSAEEIREYRGTLTEPGRNSPHRDRSVDENIDLFARMTKGEFKDGACVLRAKIDMASPNMNLRDPAIYRIRHASHYRSADKWCVYPMYDFAHELEDAFEEITHSICTLEFEHHRPVYDWVLDHVDGIFRSHQYEFARLNLSHTLTSKRKLRQLVDEGHVSGWDDPRMPTICGMRRRGYTPQSIRNFCKTIGVTKFNSLSEFALLEHSVRDDLNTISPRRMAVLRPLKVVITNYPEGQSEDLECANHPGDESMGTRAVPFSRELWIERGDFMEDPPKKFFRMGPGREVRFRYAYFITCHEFVKNDAGEVVELRCTYDPETKGGDAPDGRKVKGTIHWVSAAHALDAEIRLYDHLFSVEEPGKESGDFLTDINQSSLEVLKDAKLEPALADLTPGIAVQFERTGYFCADLVDHREGALVLNRTSTLRDTWSKIAKRK
ncbi:MAG: glutamine--tRNA ligase/YqeY domain fusion protein [Planctomycetota bacterium]